MTTWTALASLAAAGMLLVGATPSPVSAAGEECVRVVGYEWNGEKQSMDPADLLSTDDSYHVEGIYEGLVDLNNAFQPVPRLAESWEANEDGTQWTFRLREGVKFHDGSDFDAGDVVYTFRRLLDPEIGSGAKAVLAFLDPDGIEAIDKHTVRFTTKKPVTEFPVLFRTKFSVIVPEGAKREDLKRHGVGTGPFMEEKFTPGTPVRILRRNPDYWLPGLPKAACLRITVIQEAVTRVVALLSGQADLVLVVDPATLGTLKDNPKVDLVKTSAATAMTISMWVDTPPFNDVRVRQAMKLVVDRQAMVDTALLGFGEPGNDNPVAPSSPAAFTDDIRERDTAKAKQLLAEAGYPDGLEVDLYTADAYPGMLSIAQAYAQMAADGGIEVNIVNTPAESYWDDVWLKHPLLTSSWGARPASMALGIAYRKDAKWPETHWFRDDYDALLDKANATVDPEERRKLLREAQRLLADEGGVVIPAFTVVVSALRKGCTGYEPNVSVSLIDYRNLECE